MIRDLNGKSPKIATSAFISEAAYVIGEVEIGEDSSVWPGAVVRGDFHGIRIGRATSLEDNCVLHVAGGPLIIGDHVIIAHGAVVHCRRLGDYILVGNNATILEGAEVGDLSIIAAGSLVTPNSRIPPRSMVMGNPAEVRGQVTEEQILRVREGSATYIRLAREYKRQGL